MEFSQETRKPHQVQSLRRSQSTGQDTRELLIQTAKILFAEKGFTGTTVKDIAEYSHVNVSLVSYHFEGKEGLYRTCLERLGKARLAVAERVLQAPLSADEFRVRLEMFVTEVLSAHLEEPELSRIVARECDMGAPIARDIFRDTFLKVFETLVNFFKASQKRGILRKDLDMDIAVGLLFGGLIQVGQKDQINEYFFGRTIKDPKHFAQVVRNSLSFYLQGCLEDPGSNLKQNKQKNDRKTDWKIKIKPEMKSERSPK